MQVFAIIPAAGLGTRMATGRGAAAGQKKAPRASTPAARKPLSKQFLAIGGTPILLHTLRRFAAVPQITQIVVALRESEVEQFTPSLKKEAFAGRVRLVQGGDTRQESVSNALRHLRGPAPDDIVLVHDGVRPFADSALIESVIAAASKHGAAIAGTPAVDTVKQVDRTADGAIVTSTIPRERVVLAQTPQGFRFSLLQQAFADALAIGFTGTDEASLVERLGAQVAVVMGSARNIKITTPADMELAEFYVIAERGKGDA